MVKTKYKKYINLLIRQLFSEFSSFNTRRINKTCSFYSSCFIFSIPKRQLNVNLAINYISIYASTNGGCGPLAEELVIVIKQTKSLISYPLSRIIELIKNTMEGKIKPINERSN